MSNHAQGLNGAVADVLRGMLREAGWRQADLADLSGIPVVSVQRYLAGKRPIDVEVLEGLAQAMGSTAVEVVQRAAELMARRSS